MSSPQVENGYTRIANELYEKILVFPFTKRQLLIVLAVIRKTYGFGKKEDDMTLTQLADMTGIDLANVSRTVKELHCMNVLLKQQGRYGYVLGISKDYRKWKTLPKQQEVVKSTSDLCQYGNSVLPKQQTQKTTTKNNNKRKEHPLFPQFYEHYPVHKERTRAAKAFAKIDPSEELLALMLGAIDNQMAEREWKKNTNQFVPDWKHPATWLNSGCWEDEIEQAPTTNKRRLAI